MPAERLYIVENQPEGFRIPSLAALGEVVEGKRTIRFLVERADGQRHELSLYRVRSLAYGEDWATCRPKDPSPAPKTFVMKVAGWVYTGDPSKTADCTLEVHQTGSPAAEGRWPCHGSFKVSEVLWGQLFSGDGGAWPGQPR